MKKERPARPEKPVKTPTYIQMEALECGAAALGSILAFHGRWMPLEELRIECGVSRDGSKATNILKAARKYGLTTKALRKETKGLAEIKMPVIIFWNFNHFVVLEGYKKGFFYINDPAQGPRKVSENVFDQSFTGIVLTFEKGENFKKGGKKPSVFNSLGKRLTTIKAAMTYVILASLFLVIPGLLVPSFSKIFVDKVLVQKLSGWERPLLLAIFLTIIIKFILTFLQQRYLLRTETKLAVTSSAKFFRHIFRLPIEFFAQRYGGEIGNRVSLNDNVAALLTGDLATSFINLIMIAFFAVVLFSYDVVLTFTGIAIAGINLIVLKYADRKRTDLNKRMMQDQGRLIGTTMSGLHMIETLKAGGIESDFFSKWSGYQTKVINSRQKLGLTTTLLNIIPVTLMALNTTAILIAGGFRVMEGEITLGMLVAFQSLMGTFLEPVNQLVELGSKIQTVRSDMARIDDVFNYKPDKRFENPPIDFKTYVKSQPEDQVKLKLTGQVELKDITFGYSRLEPPLIENFSMKLTPGSRVAFVGASGSGKSTLSKIISGLYSPWEGEILFDNMKREQIPFEIINTSVAMVDQDIFLFEGSIRDNISMWDKTIAESQIIKAASDAAIHKDIASRTGGYDNIISEGGSNFSGGQKQRIEIARALAIKPSVLILDEATSALDPVTEKEIDDRLRQRGISCIIIAHRLSTIRDCDEIIVLEKGKPVERGTHEELMELNGKYKELITSS